MYTRVIKIALWVLRSEGKCFFCAQTHCDYWQTCGWGRNGGGDSTAAQASVPRNGFLHLLLHQTLQPKLERYLDVATLLVSTAAYFKS